MLTHGAFGIRARLVLMESKPCSITLFFRMLLGKISVHPRLCGGMLLRNLLQAMAVFHQCVTHEAKPGLLASPLR